MTELKTLKDIAQPFDMTGELLRQEAIKWIKNLEAGELNFDGSRTRNEDIERGIKGWIKYFFNITEDDLK